MNKLIYVLLTALLFTIGCSKKEKKYLPFSNTSGDTSTLSSSGAQTNVTGATLSKITVSPADQSIAKNTHGTYKATGIYSDGTIKDITTESTWSVKTETDKVSLVSSFKGKFLGTTPTSVGAPASISASVESLSGSANLNVTNANLTSIQIVAVPSLIPGGSVQYQAIGLFDDGTTQDVSSLVTWSSDAPTSIAIDSVTGIGTGGSVAAIATISASISATIFPTVANGGVANTNTVLKNVTIVSVTVTGLATVSSGSTTGYLASAIYSDGTSSDITSQATWTLSSSVNAAINNNSGNKGILTSISAGSVDVQATYVGVMGSKPVNISALTISSIAVSPSTKTIVKGTNTQFTAIASYSDGSTRDITDSAVWSSSNTAIAGVNTSATTGGLSQAIEGGSVIITATSGGKSGTGALTVSTATLVSIAINGNATIAKGTTKQYTATGTYSDASTQDITSFVSWSSTSTANVTVGNGSEIKGLATGVAQGSSTIQATLNGVNSNASTLTVSPATLSSIAIGGAASIENGATKQYTATGTFSDATTQNITSLVTWSSATPANATISNAVADKGKAYGIALGTSNITASIANGTNGIATGGGGTVTSNASLLTVTTSATGSAPIALSGVTLELSSGTTLETNPGGAFNGALMIIGDENTKGFVANITGGSLHACANVTCLMNNILQAISEDDFDFNGTKNTNSILETDVNGGYNLVTRNTINGVAIPTEIASVEIKVNNTKTLPETNGTAPYSVNDMRNHYVNLVGKSDGSGTITGLPITGSGAATSTTFRIEIQASKNATSTLIMLGITTTSNFNIVQLPLTSLVNGTNIAPSSYTKMSGSKGFTSSGPAKVDFLVSVNNSATMAGEQSGLQTSLSAFFTRLSQLGVDFRLSVTTSDCDKLWRPDTVLRGWTSGQHQTCPPFADKINDWGTGVEYYSSTNQTDFNTAIGKIGIRGWSMESNLLYAEKAIATGGTFTTVRAANGRSSVPMSVIVISDDPDQYGEVKDSLESTTTATFNKDNNEFVSQNVTVHAVYPMNASGNAGYCEGPNGNTTEAPKGGTKGADAIYPNIIAKTGGMGSTICASNPSSFMELIADQAAAGASTYNLDHVPITNTLVVKVNGVAIEMGIANIGTTKFIYNVSTNKISFTGTIPAVSTPIEVSYSYYTASVAQMNQNGNSSLMAYISKTAKSDSARGAAAAIALLMGVILAGRIWSNRKK